ncbi:MAG TPA: zf-HC2 domain-containing protein [Bryobacteraceae bacterium]|nr:zf-HC2 domain-containing protein [Bryobacteraceae bacterium]
MSCEEAKTLFTDYWSRTLGDEQETALEAHLAECTPCREEAARLETLWRELALLPGEEPSAVLRGRFYETLSAYREGAASPVQRSFRVPRNLIWQIAAGIALLIAGASMGYSLRSGPNQAELNEVAQLQGEVNNMRQLVALSLLQQQSASERLRGVSWAVRVEPSDPEVLSALLNTVNHDPNVNVRLAAVDALHPFAGSEAVIDGVMQALPKQNAPLVQVAIIDLLVDLKQKGAEPELRRIAEEKSIDAGVRQRAQWALEKLK